ncbi:MAG: hypothetical protein ABI416_11305 [Ginsengibacter sp.]
MIFLKKMLVLLMILLAMYLGYVVIDFLKSKIRVRGNMGLFLLLLLLSFGSVFLIILALGFLLIEGKDFFFQH